MLEITEHGEYEVLTTNKLERNLQNVEKSSYYGCLNALKSPN